MKKPIIETVRLSAPAALLESGVDFEGSMNIQHGGQIDIPTIRVHTPKSGGIWSYKAGCKYPDKGWVFREAVYANDIIKRAIINMTHVIVETPIKYLLLPVVLVPRSVQRKASLTALRWFTEWADMVYSKWNAYIKPEFYNVVSREIYRVGMEMAWVPGWQRTLVKIICMFFEFDDAYRYRWQDACEEMIVADMITNPAKEFVRLIKIIRARDAGGLVPKVDLFLKVIPYAFRMTGAGDVLSEFFSWANISEFYLDEADWYRACIWGGYAFRGVPDAERASLRVLTDMEWAHAIQRGDERESFDVRDKYREGIIIDNGKQKVVKKPKKHKK